VYQLQTGAPNRVDVILELVGVRERVSRVRQAVRWCNVAVLCGEQVQKWVWLCEAGER
jgi:hypothetical protein